MMYKHKFAEVEAIKVSNSSLGLKKLEKWIKRNFNDLCTVIRISRNCSNLPACTRIEIRNENDILEQRLLVLFTCYIIKQENKIELMETHSFEETYSPRYVPTIRFWE